MDDLDILRFNIKKRMIDTKKSIPDVIARMQTDGVALRNIINGTSTGCRLSTISEIADALGVKTAWLLTDYAEEACKATTQKMED